jgi:membrane protein required for colicin V production
VSGFDIAVLTVTAVLVLFGLVKGLVRIVITVAALVLAFFVAGHFHPVLAGWGSRLGWADGTLRLIAWVLLFLGVMLAGGLVAWLLRTLLKAALLGWADRLAGAFLGLAAGALVSAFVLLPLLAYSTVGQGVLARSTLAPYVSVVADLTSRLVPDDLATRYRLRIHELRRHWSGADVTGVREPEGDPA